MKHFIYHFTSILHGITRTQNVSGFIAQLGIASHRYREVTGSNPVEILAFLGFYIYWKVHNCDDHSLLDFKIRSSIYETFHISLHNINASANLARRLLVSFPFFDSSENEHVVEFLDKFKRPATLNGWNDDDLSIGLPLYLKGHASTWFKCLQGADEMTFDELSTAMINLNHFASRATQWHIRQTLSQLRQLEKESVADYSHNVCIPRFAKIWVDSLFYSRFATRNSWLCDSSIGGPSGWSRKFRTVQRAWILFWPVAMKHQLPMFNNC